MGKYLGLLGILIIILFMSPFYCNKETVIEQKVDELSILNESSNVQTFVWVRQGFPGVGDIEYSEYAFNVSKKDVDSVKKTQILKAKFIKNRIDSILKTRK